MQDGSFLPKNRLHKTSYTLQYSIGIWLSLSLESTLRQRKYLNNIIIEQDHRAVKRIASPMLGFKSFRSAQKLIAGIETIHMIKKGQHTCPTGQLMSAADRFYRLAF